MRPTEEIREFKYMGATGCQNAIIKFRKVTARPISFTPVERKWEFVECKYDCSHALYIQEDWEFLREIAIKIKDLTYQLNEDDKV